MINKLPNYRRELDKGLTLIELLITIAVIGIVVAITTPIITSLIQQAQIDAHKGEMLFMADSIEKSISGMSGVAVPPGFDLGTPTDYKRYEANERISFRFNRENANAVYSVSPTRMTRLVPVGSGTENDPYTGFCITTWIGDRNIQLNSGSTEVSDGSCGLIPGPIANPDAPSIGIFTPLSNTVGSVSYTAPTGEAVGGQSTELLLTDVRITCTPTSGGEQVTKTVAITNPVQIEGLAENVEYTCTAAVRNNGDPRWSDESAASNAATTFTPPSAPTTALGSNGPTMNVSWGTPTDDGGDPINGYIIRYVNTNDVQFDATAGSDTYTVQSPGGVWAKGVLPFENATGTVGELRIPNGSTLLYGITGTETSTSTPASAITALALTPGQSYYIAIAAYNNGGETTSWSGNEYVGYGQFRLVTNQSSGEPFIRTATQPDNILLAPDATQLTATGQTATEDLNGTATTYYYLQVTWNRPYDGGSSIIRYELQYDVQPDFLGGTGGTGPLGSTSKTITGTAPLNETVKIGSVTSSLPDSTSYFVRVRACNAITSMGDNGCGAWIATGSDPAGVATAATPQPPAAPSDATAEVDASGNATVTWTN